MTDAKLDFRKAFDVLHTGSPMFMLIFITANFNSLLLLVHIIQATQYYTHSLDHTYHRYNH